MPTRRQPQLALAGKQHVPGFMFLGADKGVLAIGAEAAVSSWFTSCAREAIVAAGSAVFGPSALLEVPAAEGPDPSFGGVQQHLAQRESVEEPARRAGKPASGLASAGRHRALDVAPRGCMPSAIRPARGSARLSRQGDAGLRTSAPEPPLAEVDRKTMHLPGTFGVSHKHRGRTLSRPGNKDPSQTL